MEKYFGAFSTEVMFARGEPTDIFFVRNHGFFYYIDGIFMLVGLYVLFTRHRFFWLMLMPLLLISPLPSVLSGQGVSYALRSSLLYTLLLIPVGVGISPTIMALPGKISAHGQKLLVITYGLLLANFLTIYFLRNPIEHPEEFFLSQRVLSSYIQRESNFVKDDSKIIVITKEPRDVFRQYLFYGNSYQKHDLGTLAALFHSGNFRFGKVAFRECVSSLVIPGDAVVIFDGDSQCNNFKENVSYRAIRSLADNGVMFKIYNSHLCDNEILHTYLSGFKWEDLRVEQISSQQFCRKFVSIGRL